MWGSKAHRVVAVQKQNRLHTCIEARFRLLDSVYRKYTRENTLPTQILGDPGCDGNDLGEG
jgi:hypothetical protein